MAQITRQSRNKRAVTVPASEVVTDTTGRRKAKCGENTAAGKWKRTTPYTRAELYEIYTFFADDENALEKLSGFMGVPKTSADAVKLLEEFAAIHAAQELDMERRGKG